MDLNNPTPEEMSALVEAFRGAPGLIPDPHDLAVIAFKHFAECLPDRWMDGWLKSPVEMSGE